MLGIRNKKILLTGGGTGGSVAPLLAVAENLPPLLTKERVGMRFLWIGTKNGPERAMVEKERIKFRAIFSGKLRRYFSWQNFIDPFLILAGFIQAFFIILKWRPNLVMTAGSFVSVPVVWAAWLLHIPVLVHQQDVRVGLANKLMVPFARVITVTFEESLKDYGKKAVWTGNPTRLRREVTSDKLQVASFKEELPVILVVGGGIGAQALNELVRQGLDKLTKFCQIIHVTGKGKNNNVKCQWSNVKCYEFLDIDQMSEAYATADIVVSRAGMGVLTELSYLGKPAILIPMPDSHQEDNAEIFKKQSAAIVLNQKGLAASQFVEEIKKLLGDKNLREELSKNINGVIKKGAGERITKIIEGYVM